MADENNAGKSFAERYAKKPSFTSQNLEQSKPQSNQASNVSQNVSSPKKPVDPFKKMQAELIYLVKGIDAGRNAWYYVLVERLKVQLFLKALNDEIIHLENYGKILFSAYGDEPPASVTDQLKEEYGIN
jgi:hypothetical protein